MKLKKVTVKNCFRHAVNAYEQSLLADFIRITGGLYNCFSTLASDMSGTNTVCVVAKAASITEINEDKLNSILESSDYSLLANSVDIESLPLRSNIKFDTQVTTRVDNILEISPVLPIQTLNKFGIRNLCVNSTRNYKHGLSLYRYKKLFDQYNKNLLCISSAKSLVSLNPSSYGGRGLTIIASIINEAIAAQTVENLFLLGVDFFGSGYLDTQREKDTSEKNIFYNIHACSSNPRETHGLPLIRYINHLLNSPLCPPRLVMHLPAEAFEYIPKSIQNSLLKTNHFSLF